MRFIRPLLLLISFILLVNLAYTQQSDISLKTSTGILHGTLLSPTNNTKQIVVLLVAGSGPTDRDGNSPVLKTNILKQLAEELSTKGIASVRYDKRGIAQSTAAQPNESELRFNTYIDDVKAWASLLKQQYKTIVLVGHSEGALICAAAAVNNQDIGALVSISGTASRADQLLKQQLGDKLPDAQKQQLFGYIDKIAQGEVVEEVPAQFASLIRKSVQPYLTSWFACDPIQVIAQVKTPVLIMHGTTDIQVPVGDADRLAAAQPKAKKVIISEVNHLLKPCSSTDLIAQGMVYSNPDAKISPKVASGIINFLKTL